MLEGESVWAGSPKPGDMSRSAVQELAWYFFGIWNLIRGEGFSQEAALPATHIHAQYIVIQHKHTYSNLVHDVYVESVDLIEFMGYSNTLQSAIYKK